MSQATVPPPAERSRARHETMYEVIRGRISLLDYEPGQRLSEEALAEEFGVSRTPIRRVLARLESEGLLRAMQGVGTIVTDVDVDTMAQIYKLRMELAELIGRLDPVPVDDAVTGRLRALLEGSIALERSPDPRAFTRLNMEFFHAVTALTENDVLREVSERLYYRTARIWIKSIDRMDLGEEVATFRREVADVLAAVEAGDLEAVGHIRRAHISMSFRRLQAKTGAAT